MSWWIPKRHSVILSSVLPSVEEVCVAVIFLLWVREVAWGQGWFSRCCRDCKESLKFLLARPFCPEAFTGCSPTDKLLKNALGTKDDYSLLKVRIQWQPGPSGCTLWPARPSPPRWVSCADPCGLGPSPLCGTICTSSRFLLLTLTLARTIGGWQRASVNSPQKRLTLRIGFSSSSAYSAWCSFRPFRYVVMEAADS